MHPEVKNEKEQYADNPDNHNSMPRHFFNTWVLILNTMEGKFLYLFIMGIISWFFGKFEAGYKKLYDFWCRSPYSRMIKLAT